MRIIAGSAAWLMLLSLGGCGSATDAGPAATAPRPAHDGVYRGSSLPMAAAAQGCGTGGPVTVLVMGGKFYFRWTPRVNLEVLVADDGSLRGQPLDAGSAVRMSGGISGSHLRAEVGDTTCRFRLELNRT